jgi:acyl carrier protein
MEPEFTLKDFIEIIDELVDNYGIEFDYLAWDKIKKVLEEKQDGK